MRSIRWGLLVINNWQLMMDHTTTPWKKPTDPTEDERAATEKAALRGAIKFWKYRHCVPSRSGARRKRGIRDRRRRQHTRKRVRTL